MKPRVMLAVSFGPGRDWCRPIFAHVLAHLAGVDEVAVVCDGGEEKEEGIYASLFPLPSSLLSSSPVRCWFAALPEWTGGPDPLRYGRLARMRSATRALFLSSDCDYLYWHDCDMIPPEDIIPRLLALDVAVATGAYAYRGLDHAMQPILHCRLEDVTADVQRCDGYGMGCMLVRREALAATWFRSPAYWREHPDGPGEDWQWGLESGLETLVDTGLSCWHCCADGWASRIVFGGTVYAVVWMGGGVVRNEFGVWRHGAVRVDLTETEAAGLPAGFARSPAREMSLEWAETRDL